MKRRRRQIRMRALAERRDARRHFTPAKSASRTGEPQTFTSGSSGIRDVAGNNPTYNSVGTQEVRLDGTRRGRKCWDPRFNCYSRYGLRWPYVPSVYEIRGGCEFAVRRDLALVTISTSRFIFDFCFLSNFVSFRIHVICAVVLDINNFSKYFQPRTNFNP